MSVEKVKEYLKTWNKEKDVIEFEVSTATVDLAAKAVGTEPKRIAKSLSFLKEEHALLVIVAGDARIDNKKFKEEFGIKARMLLPEQVETLTDHVIGGVCPFALPKSAEVYLDISLKRFPTVFPACGTPNSAIELTPEELEIYTPYLKWVDVCKEWQL